MTSAALLYLVAAVASPLPSQGAERDHGSISYVAVLCDPAKFRFSIRANATPADLDKTFPIATLVAVDDLFFAGGLPGWTGEIDVEAPLVRYERCGPYTFKLQGDAYNVFVQGESGAYEPFVSMAILRGAGILYPQAGGVLRLTECDRTLPRARPCPDGYAIRVDGQYDDAAKKLHILETTVSFEDDSENKALTRVNRVDLEENLEMWHPD